eukprot:TRINITY_DN11534_c0_g1_i1.p1 TRINITY_DN11534_c0_g1~~TRINITY_DN11534_c0_g1_i1.p1  ORF type:complete len:325 (+),score=34.26 TRINITY_DN11534_c0_g1_i1:410-1384(+)
MTRRQTIVVRFNRETGGTISPPKVQMCPKDNIRTSEGDVLKAILYVPAEAKVVRPFASAKRWAIQISFAELISTLRVEMSFKTENLTIQQKGEKNMTKRIRWTKKEKNTLIDCLNQGMTIAQISEEVLTERSVVAIRTKISKMKIATQVQWMQEEEDTLIDCLNQGMTVEQIHEKVLTSRSIESIRTKMSRKNWKSPSKKWLLPFNIIMIPLAFIAGFIQADGHFKQTGGIEIEIAKKDRHILEWMCDQFQMPHSKTIDREKKSHPKSDQTFEVSRLILPKALGNLFIQHFQLSPNKSKGQVVFPSFLNDQCLKAFMLVVQFFL